MPANWRRSGKTITLSRARALALLGSAPLVAGPSPARAQTTKVRIGAATADSYAQPYFALDAGVFGKAGLDVEIATFSNASEIIQAAAGGAIDVGLADMIQLGNAVNHGLPYGFFAGGSFYSTNAPTTVLCVAKNSPIRTAKDLEGQSVAVVALTSISSLSVQEWLRSSGADLSKIKIFETPFSTMAPALARGTVQAAFIAEPFLSGAKNDVRWLAKAYDSIAKQFYIQAWFTSRDWSAKNPDVGRRLLRAVYESARWANAHHDESAAILSKYSKLPLERIESMTRAVFATSLDPRMMQPVLEIAARYKAIEKPLAAQELVLKIPA